MILELAASRILSPYFGNTNLAWTIIIGIIMASMSLGYYVGGIIADKNQDVKMLSNLLVLAALSISIIGILEATALSWFADSVNYIPAAFLATTLVFALPSALLAAVSPYIVKLANKQITDLGKVAGKISALSTLGSITGTFLAGFVLLPFVGCRGTLAILVITLFVMAFILDGKNRILIKLGGVFLALLLLMLGSQLFERKYQNLLADIDTQYTRIWILEDEDRFGDFRMIQSARGQESKIRKGSNDLAFNYLHYYDLFRAFDPEAKQVAMIGGAGLGYPRYFGEKYPEKSMTVIEIDPMMTRIATEMLGYQEQENVAIRHDDGRAFIRKHETIYDVIMLDAFNGDTTPIHLVSKEALIEYRQKLSERGVLMINSTSGLTGDNSKDFQSIYATLQEVFPHTYVYKANLHARYTASQNLMIVGSNQPVQKPDDMNLVAMLKTQTDQFSLSLPVLTDDKSAYELY